MTRLLASGLLLVAVVLPGFGQNRRRANQPRFDSQIGRRPYPQVHPRIGEVNPNRPGAVKPNQALRMQLQRRLMQAIGLTRQQAQRMQEIRRDHEEDRLVAGRRLREARRALDRAIMSDRYDEAAVSRATEELAAAQAERIRLESRIRSEIRGVLTPDQVDRFHQLERNLRREMRQQNQQEQDRDRDLDELDLLQR